MKYPLMLGAALMAAPAAAQQQVVPAAPVIAPAVPAPLTTPDPAALEAARALLRAGDFDAQMEQTARQSGASTFNTMMESFERRQGTPFPPDLKESVRQILLADMEGLIADMKKTAFEKAASVYARYFTADELRELLRLQQNPVMAKFKQIAPTFMNELMQIGVGAAAERMPALQEKVRAEVDAWTARQSPGQRSRKRN